VRIDEITNSNILWGKLKGANFDTIQDYSNIVTLLKTLTQLNSHYRVTIYMQTILDFESILTNFINNDYGNYPSSQDMNRFNNKCKKMLSNIQYLKSKLP
jgi:hypothetical protein